MEQNDNKSISWLLKAYGFKFSKSKGQNFLIDKNIPEKIVRKSEIDKTYGVLEIGPGIGALTAELAKTAGYVIAVELDKRLIPILSETLIGYSNVEIIQGDILKTDILKLCKEKIQGSRLCVCANLPYNITTPAITALLEVDIFESLTVMVQREVARRICAKPGTADYGAFSVYANYHADCEILFDVPPQCFVPRPKVFSSVLRLKPKPQKIPVEDLEQLFFRVTRAAFSQRRKTLANALYSIFSHLMNKDDVINVITDSGFDSRIRGEALNIENFIKVSELLKKRIDEKAKL